MAYGVTRAVTVSEMENAVIKPIGRLLKQMADKAKQQRIKPIRQAITYVETHYSQQLRLEDVAGEIGLNAAYFSNIFKKETGESFTDYLVNYRMEKAKELLKESDLTICEIAMRIGYMDTRYFSKLFKKNVGIKPTDYRKIYG